MEAKKMKGLKIVLWILAIGCLSAVLGIILPWDVIKNIAIWFGIDPFPNIPIVIYFVRTACGIYVLIGIFFIILARNPLNYGPMLNLGAYGSILFGLLALIIGFSIGLPPLVYLGDGLSGLVLGVAVLIFSKKDK
jgi:hypothetical protein